MKQIVHNGTLVYYDGVQVSSGRDVAGGRYKGVLADSHQEGARYAVVEVSAERMECFHTGAPDLKALLVEVSKDGWYLAEVSKDGWYLAEVRDGFKDPLTLQEQNVPLGLSRFEWLLQYLNFLFCTVGLNLPQDVDDVVHSLLQIERFQVDTSVSCGNPRVFNLPESTSRHFAVPQALLEDWPEEFNCQAYPTQCRLSPQCT